MSITVAADPQVGKSEPVHTPSAFAGPPSPAERINTAREAFRSRPIPAALSPLDAQYLRGDQYSTAFTALLALLGKSAEDGDLTPKGIAVAVELAVAMGLASTGAVPGLNEAWTAEHTVQVSA